METMTANYASAPHITTTSTQSHLRESRPAPKSTRTVQAGSVQQPPLSQPGSQESFISVQSSAGSSIPKLQGSDSNLSQLTTYTDLTSPTSSSGKTLNANDATQQLASASQIHRDRTPENGGRTPHLGDESALASPMSITSPTVTNGAKRTASGHVKNAPSLSNTPYTSMFPGQHSRRESVSSSGSKAGELAATLKTRLGYAMAKVQNGWEHKSLAEVEQLAVDRARSNRNSMSHLDQSRPGTSGLSNGASKLSVYDNYSRAPADVHPPPSKRHSGNYSHYLPPSQQIYAQQGTAPRLQPAPELRPTSGSRASYQAPAYQQLPPTGNGMSPPRTPINGAEHRRPATIRTETQTAEAERDALQALFQLGSPHTSQIPRSQTTTSSSQGQGSPMKTDLTPRRVTFARSESASTTSSGIQSNVRETQENHTRLVEKLEDH